MSSKIAVRAEELAKRYRLGRREKYRTLRDSLMGAFTLRPSARRIREPDEWVQALEEVTFEVFAGEVVGIIGRNGAGKSTLLKILARITEPTGGRAEIHGRMSSLLEVGTGFHPELSGRENIFLNAAILGMRRGEIARRFDEIVAFAEVERFIDTPVKHFSSGMYLRLAFAVAAHLEPEILVVDEVLAVGDASFQKKCLNKMQDVGREGRTVLFVSHNMNAITRLCDRAILLENGRIVADAPSHEAVRHYLSSGTGTSAARIWPSLDRSPGNATVRLRAVRVLSGGQLAEAIEINHAVEIEMEYEVLQGGTVLVPHLEFHNEEGICLFISVGQGDAWRRRQRPKGRYRSRVTIPENFFAEGNIVVHAGISTLDPRLTHVRERDAVAFQVVDNLSGDTARGDYAGHLAGVVRPMLQWHTVSFE